MGRDGGMGWDGMGSGEGRADFGFGNRGGAKRRSGTVVVKSVRITTLASYRLWDCGLRGVL